MEQVPVQENNKIKPKDVINWGLVIIGGIIVYRVLRGTGLLKSRSEITAEQREEQLENQVEQSELKDWTNPNFYKQPAPQGYQVMVYTTSTADSWVEQLYNTHGIFNDDETAMKGLIKQIKFQTQYSFLASRFFIKYGKDMTAWLKEYYNTEELKAPFDYLNTLPTYAKK